MSNHNGSRVSSCLRELPRQFAHPGQAHLGKKVEVVFIDGNDRRLLLAQNFQKATDGVLQHGIEYRGGESMLSQSRGRLEGTERRIRLHLPHLLGVVREMIRMCQQDIRHKLPQRVHLANTHLQVV
jgi:hypothetical protein